MKKIIILALVLIVSGIAYSQISGITEGKKPEKTCCTKFVDKNNDKVCDNYLDVNNDGKCDFCAAKCQGPCAKACTPVAKKACQGMPCGEVCPATKCGKEKK